MKERTMHPSRFISLFIMLLALGLLVYAYIKGQSRTDVPGWKPANGELANALDALSSPEEGRSLYSRDTDASAPSREASKASPAASKQPNATVPSGQPREEPPSTTAQPSATGQAPPASADNGTGLLNLNAASQAQLESLPGIGPSKAKAIIDYREKRGEFRNVEELRDIKGIGPKIYEKVAQRVTVE
ncbi:helix-hairpin-helix domain-containing protein [Cohnella suwonensis]|uniref:Helix-hairpin-helix domain-containing protein n=1 Tax=Cohnella suwonensis TaxID=696072 RepID=A0ABW0M0W5_9BACL